MHRKILNTKYISLNTKNCRACWKCTAACKNSVIQKINFIIHKHVVIADEEKCTGCLACVKLCPAGAITRLLYERKTMEQAKFNRRAFITAVLIISGAGLPVSGYINHQLAFEGFNTARHFWMSVHNMLGLIFTIFTIIHIILNRKPVLQLIKKKLSKETGYALLTVAIIIFVFASHAMR